MSLIHSPSILPPPRDRIGELQREIEVLKTEIEDLRGKLLRERQHASAVEQGASHLRQALNPLYNALRQVFGDLDAMGVEDHAGTVAAKHSPVWQSWKEKMPGRPAEAIDALLLHGELNHDQLRLHLRCGRDAAYQTVSRLHKAGLINKNGGKISLKEL